MAFDGVAHLERGSDYAEVLLAVQPAPGAPGDLRAVLVQVRRQTAEGVERDLRDRLTRALGDQHPVNRDLVANAGDPLARVLWTLVRRDDVATARTRQHPRGVEVVVAINESVQMVQAFQARRVDDADAFAGAVRHEYERAGWVPPRS